MISYHGRQGVLDRGVRCQLSLVSRLASLPVFTLRVGWILHTTAVESAVSQAMILQATSAASHSLVSFLRCTQAGVTRVRAGQDIKTLRPDYSKSEGNTSAHPRSRTPRGHEKDLPASDMPTGTRGMHTRASQERGRR